MSSERPLADRVRGLVHEETQVGDRGIDLTAEAVYTVEEPGRVDFGGDELEDATLTPCETHRRYPDDDYEWWHLEAGQYLLEYNERLTGDGLVRLQTRTELREMGAFHPTLRLERLGTVPLSVAAGGVRIKENARVSTLTRL